MKVTPSIVYHQSGPEIPAELHIIQDENAGLGALVNAARDIVEGKTVSFALCTQNEIDRSFDIVEIVNLAMGKKEPRFCGEDGPESVGSHSLIPYYYSYCKKESACKTRLVRVAILKTKVTIYQKAMITIHIHAPR